MLRKLRSNLTYANVMATMAVFIALGGSSYAAIKVTTKNVPKDALTGADIKNLTGKDVKNNSLDGRDVRNLGASDFQGGVLPAGPQGAKGDKGDTGTPGAPNVIVRTNTETDGSVIVQCNTGERVTGGGVAEVGTGEITGSYPFNYTPAGPATGWQVESSGAGANTTAYVMCAKP